MKTTSARAAEPGNRPRTHSLRSLSDGDLLRSLARLRERERKALLEILLCLREIDRRRLYLPLGYPSLFEFCRRRLGYSQPQAGRRVAVARCIGEFPAVYERLARGEMTLTAAAMIAGVITGENEQEVLEQVRGRSVREVEGIVSRYRPGGAIRERVRPVWVRTQLRLPPAGRGARGDADRPAGGAGEALAKRSTLTGESEKSPKIAYRACSELDARCQDDTGLADSLANAGGESAEPAAGGEGVVVFEQRFKVEFGVDPGFLAKLERVRSLLSTRVHRRLELAELFGVLLDGYLRQHDPAERAARRERRQKKAPDIKAPQNKARDMNAPQNKAREPTPPGGVREAGGDAVKNPRYIPPKIRDEVWRRDGGRCAFVSASGRRCRSTWDLQVDHIVPLARGGDCSPGNLRLLCARHNRLEAERVYGRGHMDRFRGG